MGLFSFRKKNKKKKAIRTTVIDVTDDSFTTQVIRRSHKKAVMVDFWASWCAPCRKLGPVLERLADEEDSKFYLAKLNTEHNQRTAGRYNIRSIPAVKMFRNGHIVGEFTGIIPTPNIRRFIDLKTSGAGPAPRRKITNKPAERLRQASNHLKRGRGFEAFLLLNDFPDSPQADKAAQLLPLASFMCDLEDGDGLFSYEALDHTHLDALDALESRDPAGAIEHLLEALKIAGEQYETKTKEALESLFVLLGNKHELTQTYQPRLAKL